MDTILDMRKVFLFPACFSLLPNDVVWDNNFLFCSCRVIALAYFLGKWRRSPIIMGGISLLFGAIDDAVLHTYGNSPEDKIEEWITFALSHARLYLSESYY